MPVNNVKELWLYLAVLKKIKKRSNSFVFLRSERNNDQGFNSQSHNKL